MKRSAADTARESVQTPVTTSSGGAVQLTSGGFGPPRPGTVGSRGLHRQHLGEHFSVVEGCTTPPMSWPSSCPLPRTRSASPGSASSAARRIAARRSPMISIDARSASGTDIAPSAMASRITRGSSERGLSSVMTRMSARRAQHHPLSDVWPRPDRRHTKTPRWSCRVRGNRRDRPPHRVRGVGVVDQGPHPALIQHRLHPAANPCPVPTAAATTATSTPR